MADIITTYITSAPVEQQPDLTHLREMIEHALPHAKVSMQSGFPVWTVDEKWIAGFATRKKGTMFYLMSGGILQKHKTELGKLLSGNSCVEYHKSRGKSRKKLDALITKMLAEAGAGR